MRVTRGVCRISEGGLVCPELVDVVQSYCRCTFELHRPDMMCEVLCSLGNIGKLHVAMSHERIEGTVRCSVPRRPLVLLWSFGFLAVHSCLLSSCHPFARVKSVLKCVLQPSRLLFLASSCHTQTCDRAR